MPAGRLQLHHAISPRAQRPSIQLLDSSRLAGLKEAGLVTDDEYEAKRAEFVGQLQLKGQHVMTFRLLVSVAALACSICAGAAHADSAR